VRLRWTTVTSQQRRLIQVASPYVARWGGYLAGGTAVALRLGHRRSVDLDYFTRTRIGADVLAPDLRSIATTARLECQFEDGNRKGSFGVRIGRVSLSVLHGYSLLNDRKSSTRARSPAFATSRR